MEVRYAAGGGYLVARAGHLLLLAGGTSTPRSLLEQLWHDLGRPDGGTLALATVRRQDPLTGWVHLSAGTGAHVAEGTGRVEHDGDHWRLTVGEGSAHAPLLRLESGVVAADRVEVSGPAPAREPDADTGTPIIDGIPPDILAGHGATTPAADPDPDHDSRTRLRPPTPTSPVREHLQQTTSDTVLAVRCPGGHLTDPVSPACRVCGAPAPPQQPQRVLRPPLGVLRLPSGEPVLLDRPVVLGRQPHATGTGEWPHLVRLPHEATYISRMHLRVDLDGWHVLVRDLGSRGGTVVTLPGRDPERIRPHEPHLLEHGATVDLSGDYRLTYLTTPEEGA